METVNNFTLIYTGQLANDGMLDLYDASASYYGLARTLAIVGHYYLTGEIIAHAPRSKMPIYILPPEEGSFKQSVAAAALGGIIASPFAAFAGIMMSHWIPRPNPELEKMVELLSEQNQLLKGKGASPSESKDGGQEDEVREVEKCLRTHHDEVLMLRSITSNSFKSIFRPVGRSADRVAILRGPDYAPVGAVDEAILGRIQAEALDDDVSILVGIVNSFSKTSKVGHVYVPDDGRSYRFEYAQKGPLDPEDIFSWSQYYGRKITAIISFTHHGESQ